MSNSSKIFQGIDNYFLKKYACVMPFQTHRPLESQCLPTKEMKNEYWNLLQNTIFEMYCQISCAAMAVNYPALSLGKGKSDEACKTST